MRPAPDRSAQLFVGGLLSVAFASLVWVALREERAPQLPVPPGVVTPEMAQRECERKSEEYARLFVLPGIERPDLARFSDVTAVRREGEDWTLTGTIRREGFEPLAYEIAITLHGQDFYVHSAAYGGKMIAINARPLFPAGQR